MLFKFLLTVVLIMPEGQQDFQTSIEIRTLEECWMQAKAWVDQDVSLFANAIGLAADCQKVEQPSVKG